MRKRSTLLALLLCGAAGLYADQGTTAAAFLKLDNSPRAQAMGDAFTGISDDISALQYNVGGLGFITQKQVTLIHTVWFLDMFYDYGAVVWPTQHLGTLGFSFFYLNGGTFDGYDTNFNSTGQFTASSMYGSIAYSHKILDFLTAGLNIKFLQETIASDSTSGVAVDLGALYHTPIPKLSLGASFNNLGPSLGFSEAFSLPVNTRFGIGYKPQDNVVLGMDYVQPIETYGIWSVGGEYGYRDTLFVRMGYKYQGSVDVNQTYAGYGPAVASGLNMGLGLKLYKIYYADYAYSPYGFLGTTHHFSLTVKF
jgi:hypothetical protein